MAKLTEQIAWSCSTEPAARVDGQKGEGCQEKSWAKKLDVFEKSPENRNSDIQVDGWQKHQKRLGAFFSLQPKYLNTLQKGNHMNGTESFSGNILRLDAEKETTKICGRIREIMLSVVKRRGVVVGISGGIDSSVTAALAVDHFAFRSQGLIFVGRELTAFIDFLEFWR